MMSGWMRLVFSNLMFLWFHNHLFHNSYVAVEKEFWMRNPAASETIGLNAPIVCSTSFAYIITTSTSAACATLFWHFKDKLPWDEMWLSPLQCFLEWIFFFSFLQNGCALIIHSIIKLPLSSYLYWTSRKVTMLQFCQLPKLRTGKYC